MLQLGRRWPAGIGFVCALFISAIAIAPAADNPGQIIALKAARLFDEKSKTLITTGVIIAPGDHDHRRPEQSASSGQRPGDRLMKIKRKSANNFLAQRR